MFRATSRPLAALILIIACLGSGGCTCRDATMVGLLVLAAMADDQPSTVSSCHAHHHHHR